MKFFAKIYQKIILKFPTYSKKRNATRHLERSRVLFSVAQSKDRCVLSQLRLFLAKVTAISRQARNDHLLKPIVLLLALFLLISVAPAQAKTPQQVEHVSDMWLDVSLGPPLINWFNQTARPNDIARIENVNEIDLLAQVTAGRKLVVFKSIADAETMMPSLVGVVDIIGYNLEQGPINLEEEQADPVGSAIRMRELADFYGLQLAFGPDRNFALSDGVAIAPYVDIFVLQVQRVQTEPNTVLDFVGPLIPELRAVNPDLEVSVQIRTEGNLDNLVTLVDDLKGLLNGVSILTNPETVPTAMTLVERLQTTSSNSNGDFTSSPKPEAQPISTEGSKQAVPTDQAGPGVDRMTEYPLWLVIAFMIGVPLISFSIVFSRMRRSE